MASASGREGQPVHRGKFVSWLSKVFEFNAAGLNWPRAVMFLDVALVPLVVFWAIGHEEYLLSALFGVLFAGLADPGGGYGYRVSRIAVFALIGAGLTALGFGIGGDAWGAGARGFRGHAGGRPGGHVRGAQVRYGLASQLVVHHRPRARVQLSS